MPGRRPAPPAFAGEAARHPNLHAAALRYLKQIALRGSVRKAAQALNVAPSAVNRQLLKVEQDLGVKLFDRLPDGMRPTPAGEVMLRHIGDTLSDYDRLLGEIDGLRGIRSGHVRIVALDSLLVDFLPRVLDDFSRRYPAITFSVLAMAPAAVFNEIISAQADIGLTFVAPASPAVRLVTSVRMPLGAVMSPQHRLARRKRLDFSDFEDTPVLMQHGTLPVVPFIDDDFAAFRATMQPRFVSNSIELLRHIIRAELGVAFFTRLGFLREIAAGDLVWIPLASPRLEQLRLGLFTPSLRTLAPATSMVVSELTERFAQLERDA
ncbi:LysR family transcriptional regulator [Limobrevibacterium gyesilva]|uniref:LysR family transcriptional regulator n=1 Tax=Limobrevibacterium gyesilva TaxID=2991712 RepID=A0AA41YPD6_9PROT|nr:LysR family transcriptional regulator [Limobrevibacterium gyesilva]